MRFIGFKDDKEYLYLDLDKIVGFLGTDKDKTLIYCTDGNTYKVGVNSEVIVKKLKDYTYVNKID